jgi:hypothetical protein
MRSSSPVRSLSLGLAVVAALVAPAHSFAQAPTFNALVKTSTPSSFNFPGSAGVGDFNADGKLDALITDGSADLRVLIGNGNGTFQYMSINLPGTNPGAITTGDLNGDGKLDAVTVSNGGNFAVTVMLNASNPGGAPQFNVTNYFTGSNQNRSIAIGDLNGDGWPDLVAGNAFGTSYIFTNNGNGTFVKVGSMGLVPGAGGPSVGRSFIVDVNGDTKADYVVSSPQNGGSNVYFGNGDGTFTQPVFISSSAQYLAVVDVNGDHRPDLLQAHPAGDLLVYLNSGDGKFSILSGQYASGIAGPGSMTTADLNLDGELDVVMSDFNNGGGVQVVVMLGDGQGKFHTPTLYKVNQGPLDVAVGDFNGDAKLDIATVGRQDRTYGILLNQTSGAPQSCPAGSYISGNACALAPAGSYSAGGTATSATLCPAGTYSSAAGAAACTPASAGSFVSSTGATSATACSAGSYSDTDGSTQCTVAPAGSYVPTPGATSATVCSAGYYSDTAGATLCTPAPAGSYVASIGATSATLCAAGSYSDIAGSMACTPAPAGSFAAGPGSTGATLCPAGSFSATIGAASCTPSPAGSFVPNAGATSATACPTHYSSNIGATSCFPLDTDNDGVFDKDDAYINSNVGGGVSVGACNAGVANQLLPNGATFNDLMATAVSGAANHGARVSAVTGLSNGWKSAGLISGRDHGAIVSCVAKAK